MTAKLTNTEVAESVTRFFQCGLINVHSLSIYSVGNGRKPRGHMIYHLVKVEKKMELIGYMVHTSSSISHRVGQNTEYAI